MIDRPPPVGNTLTSIDVGTEPPAASVAPRPDRVSLATTIGVALLSAPAALNLLEWLSGATAPAPARALAALTTSAAVPPLGYAAVAGRRTFRARRRRDAVLDEQQRRVRDVLTAGDSLGIVFQPVIDLARGVCTGHEALARFADGRPPDQWFREAAAVGLGIELEMAAIGRAVQDHRGPGQLSINLSPDTLTSSAFLEELAHWHDASRVVIELTEHAIVEDYEQIAAALGRVRDLGAKVAVDDAGSGTSTMRHILDLRPDVIKLDRSLIAGLDTDMPRRALASSLVRFAADIGAVLVAEGIEREEERSACLDLGIAYGQGYLLGRPGPL